MSDTTEASESRAPEALDVVANVLLRRVGTFHVSGGNGHTYVVSFDHGRGARFFTNPSLQRCLVDAADWAGKNMQVRP